MLAGERRQCAWLMEHYDRISSMLVKEDNSALRKRH